MAYQTQQGDNQVVSDHLLDSDLFTADLAQADLPHADLRQADLPQADLPQVSYDLQSDILYELIPPLTDDSYNESISEYSQDETDIDSSLDDMGTEFDEIVFRLNISHPDEIAREAS